MTRLDSIRLQKGYAAAGLGEPANQAEAKVIYDELIDGVIALQSLDDLGSPEANQAAWDGMIALQQWMELIRKTWSL